MERKCYLVLVLLLTSCGKPSAEMIQTAIAETQAMIQNATSTSYAQTQAAIPTNTPIIKAVTPTSVINKLVIPYPECAIASIGKNVTCRISRAYCSYKPNIKGNPTYCNDALYPNSNFTLLRWGEDWSYLEGKCLIVTGYNYLYKGKPQIEVTNISQAKICDDSPMVNLIKSPICDVNQVAFIGENYPDGSLVEPEILIKKIWYLKNIGDCTWKPFELRYAGGDPYTIKTPIIFYNLVAPGEIFEASVPMLTPKAGHLIQYWDLWAIEGKGVQFYKGPQRFYVHLHILND
jgi:hypothetical protein